MEFGEKLRELRRRAHYSQKDVAKKLGISERAYQAYEQTNTYPKKREVLLKLVDLYGVSFDWLLSEEDFFMIEAAEQYGTRGKKQAEKLLNDMHAYLAGGDLSDEDRDAFLQSVMRTFFKAKEHAKVKYGRKGAPDEAEKDEV